MRPTIEKYLPDFEQIKKIKEKLKICKDEWLEQNASGQKVLGHNTIRQIIENAVEGVTYWDFEVDLQWREEVNKFDKKNNIWSFDGYVFHVRATLFIAGVGSRTQYGCKVAIGGKDNQNSAYKAATSDAFKKAASLFGIGEEIYSKIKIESEDEQAFNQIQQDPLYLVGGQAHQNQQQQQWQQPPAHQMPPAQAQPAQHQQGWAPPQQAASLDPNNPDNYPFNPFNEGTPDHAEWNRRNMHKLPPAEQAGAQPQGFVAQPAAPVQQQPFVPTEQQAPQFGAPVQQPPAPAPVPQQTGPSAVPASWDQNEMQRSHAHRSRLKLTDQNGLNPYVRDFLRDPNATIDFITPVNLKEFNDFLDKFAA